MWPETDHRNFEWYVWFHQPDEPLAAFLPGTGVSMANQGLLVGKRP